MPTVFDAAKALKENKVRTARDADGIAVRDNDARVTASEPPRTTTVSASDALKGETTGAEGERSFGAPVDRAPSAAEKSEEQIRAEIREKIARMSRNQRTDSSN